MLAATALVLLATIGATGARLGAAPMVRGALRVTVIGGVALALAAVIGDLLGTVV